MASNATPMARVSAALLVTEMFPVVAIALMALVPLTLAWATILVAPVCALVVMPLAFLLLVGGLSGPNPTAVGQEKLLEKELGPRGVLRIRPARGGGSFQRSSGRPRRRSG